MGNPGNGQKITVRLHPESGIDLELEAEIVGADFELDLAVLKLKDVPEEYAGKLPACRSAIPMRSRPGEWVIAIGNPYGYEQTVTVGHLSAKGARSRSMTRRRVRCAARDLLQTDAAINSGNSGGPLTSSGRGDRHQHRRQHPGPRQSRFAIPINTALAVVDDLIEVGYVSRTAEAIEAIEWYPVTLNVVLGQSTSDPNLPLLGVTYNMVNEEIAERLELPEVKGAYVVEVMRGSPPTGPASNPMT